MKKTVVVLMLLTIISKIIGFGREITLSYFYGVSEISDIYLIALTIPTSIFSFVGTGITTSYIPLYSSIAQENGEFEADKYTNNLVSVIFLLCILITVIVLIFTSPIVKLFASGFSGEALEMAISFTRISIFGILFSGLAYLYSGYLNIKGDFVTPALMSIPFNFVIIASIALSANTIVLFLPMGNVIARAIELLVVVYFSFKMGYRFSYNINLKDKYLIKMIRLSLPAIIGVSVNQINVIVDRTLASRISVGGISALNYANRLNIFVQGIFVISIVTAMYPMISSMAAKNDIEGLKQSLAKAIGGVNLFIVPVTVGSLFYATSIVEFLFGRGAFDTDAIKLTSSALFFYSIGMVGFGLREVVSRVFYSLHDTRTPMINASIGMLLNIILNVVLSKFLGIGGLALATSIVAILTSVLLLISLRKKIGFFGLKKLGNSFKKILFSSLIMGLISKAVYNYLIKITNADVTLLVSIGVGVLVYAIIICFMRIDDIDVIIDIVRKKIKFRSTK